LFQPPPGGTGGTSGTAGAPMTAGRSATGGSAGSFAATGGLPGVGGAAGTGVVGGSAGTVTTGGSGGQGVGGTPNLGGMGAVTMGGTGGTLAGSGGTAGSGAGSSGAGGTGATATCTITPMSTASTSIPTVHTVTFTTDYTGITKAEIEFGTAGGTTMVAPVDLMAPMYKTFLVGMKPSTMYTYRVKLTSPAGVCTSPDQTISVGALMNAPKVTITISDMAKHDKGFIVLSAGLNGSAAYIIDSDGTTVWSAPSGSLPNSLSRAHLSWDAKRFYGMALNVQNTGGGIKSIAMDGSDSQTVSGATTSHHDFTAIPGGIATLLWNSSGIDAPCSLVEFPEGGAQKTVIANISSVYNSNTFHTNAIHYYKRDDTYTMGDRNPNLYVKVSRAGALIWQFGGSMPKDSAKNFPGVATWSVNHGHHLTADGTFAFYNNGTGNNSIAFVYKLDEMAMTATKLTQVTGTNSMVLGDIQVLPNGNFLITGSTSGSITETDSSGKTVMTIKAPQGQQFGYSEFRESLYGEPPY
jgi:hypothetical protein